MKTKSCIPLWPSLVICHTLTAFVFAGSLEAWHYFSLTGPAGLNFLDGLGLWWFLSFKSWLILTLPLVLAGVGIWFGRGILGCWLYIGCSGIIFVWLTLDIGSQRMFGAHLTHYLPYIYDLLSIAKGSDLVQIGAELGPVTWVALVCVIGAGAFVVIAWYLSRWLVQYLTKRFPKLSNRRRDLVFAVLALVQLVGLVPVQIIFSDDTELLRIHSHLPVDISVTRRWANSMQRVFSGAPVGVRIVSLRVDPRGPDAGKEEIRLHNFGKGPQSLEGWALIDDSGGRLSLGGVMVSQESQLIRLAKNSPLRLRNGGGSVTLFDDSDKRRHKVDYTGDEAVGGTVINFRDENDFDAFSKRVNDLLEDRYFEFQQMWLNKQDNESSVEIKSGSRKPDILLIIVESLGMNAIGSGGISRLESWAEQGLHLNRHYSTSNITHFGIYSLLYGRLPLFYHRDLRDRIRPQLCETLSNAGYNTVFMSSEKFAGWRQMELFLNRKNFHEIMIPKDAEPVWVMNSSKWVKHDRWVFEQARHRLSVKDDKPQFIVVYTISNHYPYEYPPEFNKNQPSGLRVNYENWMKLDGQQLLNRYRNSALFIEDEIIKTLESLDSERTVVVVTGDHGESFGEDGVLSHGSRPSDAQLRVPFGMVGPGVPARAVKMATSHLDVLPTLLHALNGETTPVPGGGRDLIAVSSPPDQVILSPRQLLEPYELLVIRGDQRLLLKAHLSIPKIVTYGFLDERGAMKLQTSVPASSEEAEDWVRTILDAFERM